MRYVVQIEGEPHWFSDFNEAYAFFKAAATAPHTAEGVFLTSEGNYEWAKSLPVEEINND